MSQKDDLQIVLHYTELKGFNAIKSQPKWLFKINKPKSPNHPTAAYFTNLYPSTPNLAAKLRVPRRKLEYLFAFKDTQDLKSIRGGRENFIFYSPSDYEVSEERQIWCGKSDNFPKEQIT